MREPTGDVVDLAPDDDPTRLSRVVPGHLLAIQHCMYFCSRAKV